MSLRERTLPGLGIIEPCLPSPAKVPPSGPGWLHEIKHDGFRIVARRDSTGVRLFTNAGNDFSSRFPFIAMAVSKLPVLLCAFDLVELNGKDLRRQPIEERKRQLAKLLKGAHLSIVLNEYFTEDGAAVYRAACQLGCEGIVSKRLGSLYRRGRSPHWIKVKIRKRKR